MLMFLFFSFLFFFFECQSSSFLFIFCLLIPVYFFSVLFHHNNKVCVLFNLFLFLSTQCFSCEFNKLFIHSTFFSLLLTCFVAPWFTCSCSVYSLLHYSSRNNQTVKQSQRIQRMKLNEEEKLLSNKVEQCGKFFLVVFPFSCALFVCYVFFISSKFFTSSSFFMDF